MDKAAARQGRGGGPRSRPALREGQGERGPAAGRGGEPRHPPRAAAPRPVGLFTCPVGAATEAAQAARAAKESESDLGRQKRKWRLRKPRLVLAARCRGKGAPLAMLKSAREARLLLAAGARGVFGDLRSGSGRAPCTRPPLPPPPPLPTPPSSAAVAARAGADPQVAPQRYRLLAPVSAGGPAAGEVRRGGGKGLGPGGGLRGVTPTALTSPQRPSVRAPARGGSAARVAGWRLALVKCLHGVFSVVDVPSLSVFKRPLDDALDNMLKLVVSPQVVRQLD